MTIASSWPWRFTVILIKRKAADLLAFWSRSFPNFAFVIDGAPEVMRLPVDPDVDFIDMPVPLPKPAHPA